MQLALSKVKHNAAAIRVLKLALFSGLTAVGAVIEMPFWPVPITMQTLAVLLAGAYLGSKDGALSQIIYLFGGLVLPIFYGAGFGFAAFAGPTGGYLLLFPLLAYATGMIFKHTQTIQGRFILTTLVNAVFLATGSLWLMVVLQLPLDQALMQGAVLFLLGDMLKVATVSLAGSFFSPKS